MLLAKVVTNNTASFDWALPPGFTRYRISAENYVPATDQQDVIARVSTDGGSTFADSGYINAGMWALVGDNNHSGGYTAGAVLNAFGQTNNTGYRGMFEATLEGAKAGQYFRTLNEGFGVNWLSTSGVFFGCSQYASSTDRVTHIRLMATSGNIAGGTFYLYGEE